MPKIRPSRNDDRTQKHLIWSAKLVLKHTETQHKTKEEHPTTGYNRQHKSKVSPKRGKRGTGWEWEWRFPYAVAFISVENFYRPTRAHHVMRDERKHTHTPGNNSLIRWCEIGRGGGGRKIKAPTFVLATSYRWSRQDRHEKKIGRFVLRRFKFCAVC